MKIVRAKGAVKIPEMSYAPWPACCGATTLRGVNNPKGVTGAKFSDIITALANRFGYSCTVFTHECLQDFVKHGICDVPAPLLKAKQGYMFIRTPAEEVK